jgi:hypothetical protein
MSPEMTEPKMLTNWLKPVEHVTQCHRFDKMLPKEVFLHYIAHIWHIYCKKTTDLVTL